MQMSKALASFIIMSSIFSENAAAESKMTTVKDLYDACTSKLKSERDMCASFLYGEMTVLLFNYDSNLKICLKEGGQVPSLNDMPIMFKIWANSNKELWSKHVVYSTHAFLKQWPCN